MSENIILSSADKEILRKNQCFVEDLEPTQEEIALACKTDLSSLRAKLQTFWVSASLLAALKGEVAAAAPAAAVPARVAGDAKPGQTWADGTWIAPVGWGNVVVKPIKKPKEDTEDLPLAPTTAFNIFRLVQLWYFPKDFAPLWWDKPNIFHKWLQAFYVLPGQLWEWTRTKAHTAFQKKYDRDAAYKDFMLDLTKQMDSELKWWFEKNKMTNGATITEAKTSLENMRSSFTAWNDKEAFAHFDTLAERMWMRVDGRWHERPQADRDALRTAEDTKTSSAEKRVALRTTIKERREWRLAADEASVKDKKAIIDQLYAREQAHTPDARFNADGVKIADINTEISKLQLEKTTLENHTGALATESQAIKDAVAGRSFSDIEATRTRIGYAHGDTFLPVWSELTFKQWEIDNKTMVIGLLEKPNGTIELAEAEIKKQSWKVTTFQTEEARLSGQIADSRTLDTAKTAFQARLDQLQGSTWLIEQARTAEIVATTQRDTARGSTYTYKTELQELNTQKKGLLAQSEQNKVAFDWFSKRQSRITHIENQVRVYTELKPLIVERERATNKLAGTKKTIDGSTEAIAKREQKVRTAHADASPMHQALDRFSEPGISQAKNLELNEELNKLLAQKNPEALRIEGKLKGTPTERAQALRDMQNLLDARGKWVEFFKTSLDSVETRIKALQTEAGRIMTEYDKQAGTGDVEALRKKTEVEIGKINSEIERYNNDARAKYGAAAATLTPLQLDSLHAQSKLWGFFDAMNTGTSKLESIGSTKAGGKAMRVVYGALTLVGLGQIGVTTANSGLKQWAIDAADMGIGFIPVVGWAYDIVVWFAQWVMGEEITSKRKVDRGDAIKRVWFGMLGLVPILWQAAKAWATWGKIVDVARKVAVVERTAQITWKVLILNEAKNLWVALYDATGSVVSERGGIQKTVESVYTGTRFPVNTPAK